MRMALETMSKNPPYMWAALIGWRPRWSKRARRRKLSSLGILLSVSLMPRDTQLRSTLPFCSDVAPHCRPRTGTVRETGTLTSETVNPNVCFFQVVGSQRRKAKSCLV